jgi:hypothetical protein
MNGSGKHRNTVHNSARRLQQTLLERQRSATPGDQQHDEATRHHDPEREDRDGDRRTLAARSQSTRPSSNRGSSIQSRCRAAVSRSHRRYFRVPRGPCKQDFGCGLFVMPTCFDRCELDRLACRTRKPARFRTPRLCLKRSRRSSARSLRHGGTRAAR